MFANWGGAILNDLKDFVLSAHMKNKKVLKEEYLLTYEEDKENHYQIAGDFTLGDGHYDLRVYADYTYGKTLMITYSGFVEE